MRIIEGAFSRNASGLQLPQGSSGRNNGMGSTGVGYCGKASIGSVRPESVGNQGRVAMFSGACKELVGLNQVCVQACVCTERDQHTLHV